MAKLKTKMEQTCIKHQIILRKKDQTKPRAKIEIELRTKWGQCQQTIDLGKIEGIPVLAITGTIVTEDYESSGQCIEQIKEVFGVSPDVIELCSIWERWHLNDMRAGTRTQQAKLDYYYSNNPTKHYDFTEACRVLQTYFPTNYYEEIYWENGETKTYKYGHAWLYEPLPMEVNARLRNHFFKIDKIIID